MLNPTFDRSLQPRPQGSFRFTAEFLILLLLFSRHILVCCCFDSARKKPWTWPVEKSKILGLFNLWENSQSSKL